MDSAFDFERCFRIAFHWLVASGSRVEQQVQSLQRRCTQFGLYLISLPEYSACRDTHVLGFVAPPFLTVRDAEKAKEAENSLMKDLDFIRDSCHQGIDLCDLKEYSEGFDFEATKYSKKVSGKQYVHISGGVFVRVIEDKKGWKGFFWVENRSLLDKENLHCKVNDLFKKFQSYF